MKHHRIDRTRIFLSIISGILLSASFPKLNIFWLAWFALVPLLISLNHLSPKDSFVLGFLAGLSHYLTLMYWVVYTMQVYGNLPFYLSIPVLVLLSTYLALYVAVFSLGVVCLCPKPAMMFFLIPVLWVALEYIRSFLLSGFPWELIGYSQFQVLQMIQISDIFGVYGVSFLIALSNAAIFLAVLYIIRKDWHSKPIAGNFCAVAVIITILILSSVWIYGKWRIKSVDEQAAISSSANIAVVQGNIDQMIKWKPAFQRMTIQKYLDLSLSVKTQKPDLVVWPETATPFYFTSDPNLTELVLKGVHQMETNLLTGSPSLIRSNNSVELYNSAYLINGDGKIIGKYDKAHLVPFGEYVPLKRWLPFIDKMVEQVGDFKSGEKGKTIQLAEYRLGTLICYEIIFSDLSRAMAKNGAGLLVNITNDAWYGTTSAPYQHFSMVIFRAVENKRTVIRSANTGISGFIDPVGRVMDSTPIFQDAVKSRRVPIIQETTFYTQFGDVFAIFCLTLTIIFSSITIYYRRYSHNFSRSKTFCNLPSFRKNSKT